MKRTWIVLLTAAMGLLFWQGLTYADGPREKEVDRREANQAKRIEQGIAKGYLTPDEITALQAQEDLIAKMEAGFKADGKLTKDEFKALNQALDAASRMIWADKHNTEGNQMPVYRLGKNIFAKDDLTKQLADENLSPAVAKALLRDFHHLIRLRRRLASEDLKPEVRAKLQTEYNDLLNKYFEIRETAAKP